MTYSFIERKRIRKSFSRQKNALEVSNLLAGQFDSFRECLQADVTPSARKNTGFQSVIKSIGCIKSKAKMPLAEMHLVSYELEAPVSSVDDCRLWGSTYCMKLLVNVELKVFQKPEKPIKDLAKRKIKYETKEKVFLGEVPCMTPRGSFLINGTDRIVVSQLRRSPGVIFDSDKGKTSPTGKVLYKARLIPHRGEWLDFEFDLRDLINFRIDRKRKIPVTLLLRAMGDDEEQILETFYDFHTFSVKKSGFSLSTKHISKLESTKAKSDILHGTELLVSQGERLNAAAIKKVIEHKSVNVDNDYLMGEVLATQMFDDEGEVIPANTRIDAKILEKILANSENKTIQTLVTNSINLGDYISTTLRQEQEQAHKNNILLNKEQALALIYQILRPGEPADVKTSEALFNQTFFSDDRFDLSPVGRMKINHRLGLQGNKDSMHLSREDIIATLKTLVDVRNGNQTPDDVDHLGNRRVRTIKEMMSDQFRMGLMRVEKVVSERLANIEDQKAVDLVNPKPVTSALKEFFGGNRLSQFMDQTNPLSEVSHKRRLSALGPSGLTRERAGYEVRDVHNTHYGRLCPVESPEGQNIGLISSIACHARIDDHGFLQTPYRQVIKGVITDKIDYISPLAEKDQVIAQINSEQNEDRKLTGDSVLARKNGEFGTYSPDEIDYIDVSSQQIISVASSLIPFLEHNAANRALMGANMQRQAVPLLQSEKPLVGTGMERRVALDSFTCIIARSNGVVEQVDANMIVVRNEEDDTDVATPNLGVEIYSLEKFDRTNQDTCINQKPLVKLGDRVKAGDIIADGSSIDKGELSVGRNVRVAFMMWNGDNFEDSVIISEKLLHEDVFTSIHIKELVCVARDGKHGPEEITSDIPSATEVQTQHIDDCGIVYIGAKVKAGDILVGRISPKNEQQQTPEEKLLKAIFGEKSGSFKDISLKVPNGSDGTVIDVQIMTNPNLEKGERAKFVEQQQIAIRENNYQKVKNIREGLITERVHALFSGQKCTSGHLKGEKLNNENLADASFSKLMALRVEEEAINETVKKLKKKLTDADKDDKETLEISKKKIVDNYELPSGVRQSVKVKLAVRRKIQPGDKMSGRFGNKGVVSTVLPIEDMPFDEHGEPVDIILNPLGLPSRMNIGQILETNLGWASKELGRQIGEMIDNLEPAKIVREHLTMIYNDSPGKSENLDELSDDEVMELARNLKDGFPMASPVFDGADEQDVRAMLKIAKVNESGMTHLYDGRTGERYHQPVTTGYKYMMKLDHLVEDKMHARSTGPYTLVTQQPLGGKANKGGQRLGEMEVWALEAYGAAYTLREMLTVKSDDLVGRKQAYRNMMLNDLRIDPQTPESFNVLVREIQSLGIDLEKVYEKDPIQPVAPTPAPTTEPVE